MNLFDLTEGKAKKQAVNEGIEIVYEKIDEDYASIGTGGAAGVANGGGAAATTSPENNTSVIGSGADEDINEDDAWHSGTSDQWHGQNSDAWHGSGAGTLAGTNPGMAESPDTAERLKRNLKRGGFDMDRFEAKIAEIERRNKELADEFYARHPELDDRIKDESSDEWTSVSAGGGTGAAATLGTDNDISPVGSGTVDEGREDEVGFGVSSERAYNAVMAKFGDYIEHRDDGVMYAPRRLWGAIEQTAFDADGVGAEEDSGIDEDQYGGGFGGGSVGPVTDSTSPVGGGGASVAEGWKEKVGAAALAGAIATGAGAKTPKVPLHRAIDNATIVYNNNKFIKKEIEKHKEKASDKQVKNEGVTEAEEQGAHVKYYQGYNDAKNSKPSIHKTLTGNDRHNYVIGYKDGLTDRKKTKQQGVTEGWKEKVAGGAMAIGALGGIGALQNVAPNVTVQGQQYQLAMPGDIPDNAKLATTDDGEKVYVWKTPGNKNRVSWSYRPVEQVKEQGVVEAEFEPHTAKFGKQVLGYGKGRDEPEGHNNIEIQINGRTWKIFPGAGAEGSKAWFEQKQKMRELCKRKSAETGKEWRMYVTGRPTTESVAEGQLEFNTPDPVVVIQDKQGKILDQMNLSVAAQKYRLGQPENIKKQLAHQNYTTIGNYVVVSPMSGQPQDSTTQNVPEAKEAEITEDIYESRLYKMKRAGYFE